MLCPNVNYYCDVLSDAYVNMLMLKNYNATSESITISQLKTDPSWLPSLRTRISALQESCVFWDQTYPEYWSQLLLQFMDYTTIFSGFEAISKKIEENEIWCESLGKLEDRLEEAKITSRTISNQYLDNFNKIKNYQFLLEDSIKEGWKCLNEEEEELITLTCKLVELNDEIAKIQSDLSGEEFRAGKSYTQFTVKMIYNVLIAAETSVPFFAGAGLIFTIGSTYFDIIKKNKKIEELLKEITSIQITLSQEAQAMAVTKMTLQMLYNLIEKFSHINAQLSQITNMWDGELQKVKQVQFSISTGADPKTSFDLLTMTPALATWNTLTDLCKRMIQPLERGEDIIVDISNNNIFKSLSNERTKEFYH